MNHLITYFHNATATRKEIFHEPDLSLIGHRSISCEDTDCVALNDSDYHSFISAFDRFAAISIILDFAQDVTPSYFDLMTSGDIAEALK